MSPLAELKLAVREARVLGTIGVCELHRGFDRDAMARVQWQLVDEGAWLRPFGKLLYTMPDAPVQLQGIERQAREKIGEAMFKVASKL